LNQYIFLTHPKHRLFGIKKIFDLKKSFFFIGNRKDFWIDLNAFWASNHFFPIFFHYFCENNEISSKYTIRIIFNAKVSTIWVELEQKNIKKGSLGCGRDLNNIKKCMLKPELVYL